MVSALLPAELDLCRFVEITVHGPSRNVGWILWWRHGCFLDSLHLPSGTAHTVWVFGLPENTSRAHAGNILEEQRTKRVDRAWIAKGKEPLTHPNR